MHKLHRPDGTNFHAWWKFSKSFEIFCAIDIKTGKKVQKIAESCIGWKVKLILLQKVLHNLKLRSKATSTPFSQKRDKKLWRRQNMHISLNTLCFNMMNWLVSWTCSIVQNCQNLFKKRRRIKCFQVYKSIKWCGSLIPITNPNPNPTQPHDIWGRHNVPPPPWSLDMLKSTIRDIFQPCQDVGPEEVDPKYLLQISWSCDRHTFITAAGCRWPLTIITWRRISTSKSFD